MDPLQWYFNLVCFGNTCNVQGPGAPLTYFNRVGGGGGGLRLIFYTQKIPNFRICLPKKKITTFFSIPQKIPLFFFQDPKNPGVFYRPKKITFGQNFRPKKIAQTPPPPPPLRNH